MYLGVFRVCPFSEDIRAGVFFFFSTGVRVFVPLLSGHRIVVGDKRTMQSGGFGYFAGFAGPPTGSIAFDYAPCRFENEINSLCLWALSARWPARSCEPLREIGPVMVRGHGGGLVAFVPQEKGMVGTGPLSQRKEKGETLSKRLK